jgi:nicotinate-nucleotide adenylyltransferase
MLKITEKMLDALREEVRGSMSPKRFVHTAAVEEMIARLCALYCPEHTLPLRAAALLHDLTKELSPEAQESLCEAYDIPVDDLQRLSPKTYHAKTAAARIPRDFPQFAAPIIIDAVRWHTTGHAAMTLTEKLLYLADYIDESRTFSSCVLLRRYFFGAEPEQMTREERERHLRATLLLSYEFTLKDLLAEGAPVDEDTVRARNELLVEAAKATN